MVDHLTECPLLEPCSAETTKHGFCSRQNTLCIHCERECICDRLRACEERVLDAARGAVEGEWTEDPSWDGTNWNNALFYALESIDALRKEKP